MDFGTRLKEARSRIELRQEDIADAIGVSRQTVSNWENEKRFTFMEKQIRAI